MLWDTTLIGEDGSWVTSTINKETTSFIRPVLEALPQEVKRWAENSLKFDMTDFANAKEFEGKQYLFVRSGTGGLRGERLI